MLTILLKLCIWCRGFRNTVGRSDDDIAAGDRIVRLRQCWRSKGPAIPQPGGTAGEVGAGVDASLAEHVRVDRRRCFLLCLGCYVPVRVVQRQPASWIQQPRLRRGHAAAEAVCWRLANELVASICDEGNGRLYSCEGIILRNSDGHHLWPFDWTVLSLRSDGRIETWCNADYILHQ